MNVYFLILDDNKAFWGFPAPGGLNNVLPADCEPTGPQVSRDDRGQTWPRLQTEKVNKTSGWIPSRQESQAFVS